jgi:hypothetical protein
LNYYEGLCIIEQLITDWGVVDSPYTSSYPWMWVKKGEIRFWSRTEENRTKHANETKKKFKLECLEPEVEKKI